MTIYSDAPSGGSTGTSAAVTVALIGALDRLTPGRMTPHEVALTAQHIETAVLKQQCGIQDQICSAYGGINYIEMFQYPHASVSPIVVPNSIWWELERRLVLVYLGKSHSSSKIHEMVIRELENAGPDSPKLDALRDTAPRSRDALYGGDFRGLGKAMIDNTEAQRRLHPMFVSADADAVILIAKRIRRIGLEGQWSRRRRGFTDDPLWEPIPRETGDDQSHRGNEPALSKHSHLLESPGLARLGGRRKVDALRAVKFAGQISGSSWKRSRG